MSGTFGYELDPARLTADEKREIREQLRRFRALSDLIDTGALYRLTAGGKPPFTAWQFVSPDQGQTLLNIVLTNPEANPRPLHICLQGLDPDAEYMLEDCAFYGCGAAMPAGCAGRIAGAALMYAGITLPPMLGDTPSAQLVWRKTKNG